MYPRLYSQAIDPKDWLRNYLATYIERDVRQILNIGDMVAFERFITLAAARTGNLLNYSDIGRDAQITHHTAKAWFSILQTSFVVHFLEPYYKNFGKRVIKSPKLFFYDTGLLCALLSINSVQELMHNPLRGAIFETFILSEIMKYYFNRGLKPPVYFWRDVQGHEVDCVIEKSFGNILPIEIKSTMTLTSSLFDSMSTWSDIANYQGIMNLVYAGDEQQMRTSVHIYPWFDVEKMMQAILL